MNRLPLEILEMIFCQLQNNYKWAWPTVAFSISQQALTELSDKKFKNPTNK